MAVQVGSDGKSLSVTVDGTVQAQSIDIRSNFPCGSWESDSLADPKSDCPAISLESEQPAQKARWGTQTTCYVVMLVHVEMQLHGGAGACMWRTSDHRDAITHSSFVTAFSNSVTVCIIPSTSMHHLWHRMHAHARCAIHLNITTW